MSERKKFLGRGLSYPLETSPAGDFQIDIDSPDTVRSAIIFLLHTRIGERPHRAETGSRLMDFKHEPNSPQLRDALAREIKDTISQNEPRVADIEVSVVTTSRDDREVLVSVTFIIIGENVRDNLVFPFLLG